MRFSKADFFIIKAPNSFSTMAQRWVKLQDICAFFDNRMSVVSVMSKMSVMSDKSVIYLKTSMRDTRDVHKDINHNTLLLKFAVPFKGTVLYE
jgi:hypothetical protein